MYSCSAQWDMYEVSQKSRRQSRPLRQVANAVDTRFYLVFVAPTYSTSIELGQAIRPRRSAFTITQHGHTCQPAAGQNIMLLSQVLPLWLPAA